MVIRHGGLTAEERIKKAVEVCKDRCSPYCPYWTEDECRTLILTDCAEAIAERDERIAIMQESMETLEKRNEPRVMALDEIKEGEPYWFQMGHRLPTRAVICVYREDDAQKPYVTFTWQFGTFSWESEDYNKSWRCWTAKPTDEQIEAVKWDD